MWELEFGVVELARANRHGRAQMRREERVRCDAPITVFRANGDVATGFGLDRSAGGARVILDASCEYAVSEQVTVDFGHDSLAFRVVWARHQDGACVLGLERAISASGEVPVVNVGYFEDEEVTRAA